MPLFQSRVTIYPANEATGHLIPGHKILHSFTIYSHLQSFPQLLHRYDLRYTNVHQKEDVTVTPSDVFFRILLVALWACEEILPPSSPASSASRAHSIALSRKGAHDHIGVRSLGIILHMLDGAIENGLALVSRYLV